MSENHANAFENKSETEDKRLTLKENQHKSQLELIRDKFVFEKEKASDDRMKASVRMFNGIKKEALKCLMSMMNI